jgi:putative membrane protein
MKRIIRILPLFIAGVVAFGCGPKKVENTNEVAEEANEEKFEDRKDEKDAEFVAETVASNYAEIALAILARDKSNNPQVKEVAQELEAGHNKILGELQSFASAKVITVPTEAKDAEQKTIEKLREEKDVKEFNKKWSKELVDKHEKSIKEFEARLEKTQDADLKIWIEQTLPHLREHLDKVKALESNVTASR